MQKSEGFQLLGQFDEWTTATMRVVVTLAARRAHSRRFLALTASPIGHPDPIAAMLVVTSNRKREATFIEFEVGGCPLDFATDFWVLAEDRLGGRIGGRAVQPIGERLSRSVSAERAKRSRDRTLRRARSAGRIRSNDGERK